MARVRQVIGLARRFAAVAISATVGGDDGKSPRQSRRKVFHMTWGFGNAVQQQHRRAAATVAYADHRFAGIDVGVLESPESEA
jgi:hypothetical protein